MKRRSFFAVVAATALLPASDAVAGLFFRRRHHWRKWRCHSVHHGEAHHDPLLEVPAPPAHDPGLGQPGLDGPPLDGPGRDHIPLVPDKPRI